MLALSVLSGCGRTKPDERPIEVLQGNLLSVVDSRDVALGLAAVVRVTGAWAVALAPLPRAQLRGVFVRFENERVPVQVLPLGGDLSALTFPRGARALRAVALGAPPVAGQSLGVFPIRGDPYAATARELVEGQALFDEVNEPQAWRGAWVLDGVSLVGYVPVGLDPKGRTGRPRAMLLQPRLAEILPALCAAPGADTLTPSEDFVGLELRLEEQPQSEVIPALSDAWGAADLYLGVDWGLRPLARFRLGRVEEPVLVALPRAGTLLARVVERDVTLTEGVDEEDLAPPLSLDPAQARARLRFALDSGGSLDVTLGVAQVDPDRASERDRTPFGARALGLRRVARGAIDLRAGDATDHWRLSATEGGQHLVFFYVRDPRAELDVEGWIQGEARPRWSLRPSGRRLVALRRTLSPGGALVRVRQTSPSGPTAYGLLIHPLERDPTSLLRALFRLFGSEASQRASAFLGGLPFALEVYRALSEEGSLSSSALSTALLGQLGHRIAEARQLALNLLEVYLPPELVELEAVRREGGRRGIDAGLLMASRCPTVRSYVPVWRSVQAELEHQRRLAAQPLDEDGDPIENTGPPPLRPWSRLRPGEREDVTWAAEDALAEGILLAAGDADPEMRMRAIAVGARLREEVLRNKLRAQLEGRLARDPSRRVQRALLSAFR